MKLVWWGKMSSKMVCIYCVINLITPHHRRRSWGRMSTLFISGSWLAAKIVLQGVILPLKCQGQKKNYLQSAIFARYIYLGDRISKRGASSILPICSLRLAWSGFSMDCSISFLKSISCSMGWMYCSGVPSCN